MAPSRTSRAIGVCALALTFNLAGWGQSGNEGSIEGIVTDPAGAVVPGVALKLTNVYTSATFTTTTNETGLFRFPVASVGTYELVAERAGFAVLVQKDIVVTVGARINLRLVLKVAGKVESVVVGGDPPLVESIRSQVSTTVNAHSVASLPTNGRNFLDFVLLTPGVTRGARGFDLSFAGERKMSLVRLDGADNDNTFFGEVLGVSGSGTAPYQISLVTVQEFQVNTSSYSAEIGRSGGGVVDVVTKSGTNDFHGTSFWYYRDRSMNATDLINKLNRDPKSPFHFHQFGGALGGPVVKDTLFFFATYDGQRSTEQNVVRLNLPAGFQLSSDAVVAGFQQRALEYLTARTAPWIRTFNQNVYFARLDWRTRPAHLWTWRWNRQRFVGEGNENRGPQNSIEHTGESISNTDTLGVSLSSTLSTSMVNVARFSYVGSKEPGFANSSNPEANILEGGLLVLAIGRNPISPRENAIQRFQWFDALSYSRGRHLFKFGADVLSDRIAFFTAVNFWGSYRFGSLESFGRNLAGSTVLAKGESYLQAFSGEGKPGVRTRPDFVEFGGFLQDEWRVASRLTFNLGCATMCRLLPNPR